jgi:hypothetical protein
MVDWIEATKSISPRIMDIEADARSDIMQTVHASNDAHCATYASISHAVPCPLFNTFNNDFDTFDTFDTFDNNG